MENWQRDLLTIIFKSKFMALATADTSGVPWVSPLVYACDEQLCFYWVSAHEARHSLNLAANPRAALTIYDSKQRPNIKIQGFYAEGSVNELREEELERGTHLFYGWRYPKVRLLAEKLRGPKHFMGDSARRMYRLVPTKTYGLDPAGHPIWGTLLDFRVEVSIREEFASQYTQKFKHLF
jgi:nitroimidazol reductase NimA-like FMN-containing flavoprotein (pyridoxamine 5'-phosphate oxidase superfamily)